MYQMYILTDNKKIVILNGKRESFRCRQRNKYINDDDVKPFRFVSYRSMMKEARKNKQKVYKGFKYDTIAKL